MSTSQIEYAADREREVLDQPQVDRLPAVAVCRALISATTAPIVAM